MSQQPPTQPGPYEPQPYEPQPYGGPGGAPQAGPYGPGVSGPGMPGPGMPGPGMAGPGMAGPGGPGPGQPPPGALAPGQQIPMTVGEARQTALLIHLSSVLLGFIGPVIGYAVWGPRDVFVRAHAVQALNFQLTVLIAMIVTIVASFFLVGFILLPFVIIATYAFPIIAAVKANNGEWYKYPVAIPFLR